jgi:type I restriction enzyme M protein
LDDNAAFSKLSQSKKKDPTERQREINEGKALQKEIKEALTAMDSSVLYKNRALFQKEIIQNLSQQGIKLPAALLNAVIDALSERDEHADICTDSKGQPEPDSELRDTENVPLTEDMHAYFKREVLPHAPDAWIDESKTKIGYEIPLNRHFYVYQPPRALEEIEAEMKALEKEIAELLEEL